MCGDLPPSLSRSRLRRTSVLAGIAVGLALSSAGAAQAANNPGTGDTGFFTFRPSTAVGGTQINVASGNALVRTRDLADSDGNYHVVVDRAYNSLATDAFSILSPRWGFDVGPATKVAVQGNGDALVTGPSGYRLLFVKQPDGTLNAPAGFDGSLLKTPSGWTLSRTSQGDQFGFNGSGQLSWTKDRQARDFTVQGTSAAGRDVLSSYGTNSGRRVNLSYTGDSLVREMDDPSSGHHYYGYTGGKLTSYRSPSGAETTYRYAANGYLDKITEAGGTTVELATTAGGKVQSITTTLPGAAVGQTTSFVYTRRPYKTDVTGPDQVRRTYAYDDDYRVTRQYNPDVKPSVVGSGSLFGLPAGYTRGVAPLPVTLTATEPDGSGIARVGVRKAGAGGTDVASLTTSCTVTLFDRICPQTFTGSTTADLSGLPQGQHTLQAFATDEESNESVDGTTTDVVIDRTAPPGPDAVVIDDFEPDTGATTLGVDPADAGDPDVAPGIPGSGVAAAELRWRRAGGAWTPWSAIDAFEVEIGTTALGDLVEVETRSIDDVGNVSPVRHDNLTVAEPPVIDVEETPDPEWPEEETDVGTGTQRLGVPVELDGEAAEPGWIVKVRLPDGDTATARTDENGVAHFVNAAPGTYTTLALSLDPETPIFDAGDLGQTTFVVPSAAALPSGAPAPRGVTPSNAIDKALKKLCDSFSQAAVQAYCNLTDAESAYLKDHVRLGLRFLADGNDAVKTTYRIFGADGDAKLDATKANSFQHSYWVAMMTRRTYQRVYDLDLSEKTKGGLTWSTAHESEAQQDPDPFQRKISNMDLHNNAVGARHANASESRRKNNGRLCTGMRRATFSGRLGASGARSDQLYWLYSKENLGRDRTIPNPAPCPTPK